MDTPVETLLSGYRVLDLSTEMGAFCGKLFGDLGMDVIKVEPPCGDPLRREPPFAVGHSDIEGSLRFAYLNAGKRGITLDLTKPAGRSAFLDLVERSDIVLESCGPGYLETLGLGYGTLAGRQKKLIVISLSGFGQSGPYASFAVRDIVTMAMGGLLYISGDPAFPPCMPPETQSYYYGSLYAAYGAMLALWQRETQGVGAYIDASIQAAVAIHEHAAFTYSSEQRTIKREGSQHHFTAPANLFQCKDGYISIFATQHHWPIFLEVWKDHPKELDDPRWMNNRERRAHADWINELVSSFTSLHDKEALASALQERGIPALPVNTPADFVKDSQIQDRQFFGPVTHPEIGAYQQPSVPFLVNGQRLKPAAAPTLGQHNHDVYCGELGLSRDELDVMVSEGTV